MRLQHWVIPFIGLLLALEGSGTARAQFYDPTQVVPADGSAFAGPTPAVPMPVNPASAGGPIAEEQFPYFDPTGPVPYSGPGAPAGGAFIPGEYPSYTPIGYAPEGYGGMPAQFQPWPQISPYDHSFSDHFVDQQGLWNHDFNDDGRKVFMTIDATLTSFRFPKDRLIGSEAVDPGIFVRPRPSTEGLLGADPVRTNEVFKEWDSAVGLMIRLGFVDPDQSGVELKGLWTGEWTDSQLFGNLGADQDHPLLLNVRNPGLSLDDGTGGVGQDTNANTFSDMHTQFEYKIQAGGASLTRWRSPFIKRDHFKVRQTYGIRYIGLEEEFSVFGAASMASYTVPDPPFTAPDPTTYVPFADETIWFLRAYTQSHLAGPELGLQMELGGDKFLVRTETKFGLMANREFMTLEGQGLGNQNLATYDPDAKFNSRVDHTHVSPTFEQNINADMTIIHLLPLLKNVRILEDAKIRVGYNFFVAFEVTRPTDSILYLAPPVNPQIDIERTAWFYSMWNFGIDWTR